MAVTVSVDTVQFPNSVDKTQQNFIVSGLLTLTGNYGAAAAHGDPIPFSGLETIHSDQINHVEIFEEPTAGNAPTGYTFLWARGTNLNNSQLVVMQPQGTLNPQIEITQGSAYPAALTAATANIKFRLWAAPFV